MYVNPEHYMKLGYTTVSSEVTTTGLTTTPAETPLPTTMATLPIPMNSEAEITEPEPDSINPNADFNQMFSSTPAHQTNVSSPAVIETLEQELFNSTSADGYITTEEATLASTTIPGIDTTTMQMSTMMAMSTVSSLACSQRFCDTTKWTSRDKPSGTGDHERF